MSTVSVIIPAYNLEACLEQSVYSALRQTHPPLEILIIDNNSTDDTLQIARTLEARYPSVVRILQEPRQGAPYARNLGLAEAKGTWIQYLDGDDLLMPGKLEYQLMHIHETAGFVASTAYERDLEGAETMTHVWDNVWKGLFAGGGHLGFTSSILWNATALHAINGWDIGLRRHQEYDLMFRLLVAGYSGVIAPEAHTIKCRRASGQISDIPYPDILLTSLGLRSQILRYAIDNPDFDKKTMSYFFHEYFRRFTRLRVRRPDYAAQIKQQYIKNIISAEVRRQYPIIYWIQLRSNVFTIYRQIKTTLGMRGLLGKFVEQVKPN